MDIELKKEALASYLNLENINDVEYDSYNIFTVDGDEYTVLDEDESYDYLKSYFDESISEYEFELKDGGFGFLIGFIDWDKFFEGTDIEDFDFYPIEIDGKTYYISNI